MSEVRGTHENVTHNVRADPGVRCRVPLLARIPSDPHEAIFVRGRNVPRKDTRHVVPPPPSKDRPEVYTDALIVASHREQPRMPYYEPKLTHMCTVFVYLCSTFRRTDPHALRIRRRMDTPRADASFDYFVGLFSSCPGVSCRGGRRPVGVERKGCKGLLVPVVTCASRAALHLCWTTQVW